MLTAAAAGVALLVLRVVSVVVAGRLQNIPGGPPFWMTFGVSYRTLLFVAVLALAGAAVSGLVPALQATGRLARLGAGALAGRTSVRLGATWTTLVIAQVAFSVGVLPLAAELAWGTLRTGVVGPGFAAEEFATARVALEGGSGRVQPDADALWQSPARVGATAAGRPGHPRRGGRLAATRRGALGVRRHRGPRRADRGPQRPAAGIPRPVQPGRYRVLRSLSGAWPRRSPIQRRATLPRRPMRSSSTATSPRPSPPAATRSDAVSGTSARRAASGCTARKRTVGTKSSVSSAICP